MNYVFAVTLSLALSPSPEVGGVPWVFSSLVPAFVRGVWGGGDLVGRGAWECVEMCGWEGKGGGEGGGEGWVGGSG